jgi:uroporphyrinogen-III synthase
VYETICRDHLTLLNDFKKIPNGSSVVFFSPSGFHVVLNVVGIDELRNWDCIAIGKTTLKSLVENEVNARVSNEPSAVGLLSIFI